MTSPTDELGVQHYIVEHDVGHLARSGHGQVHVLWQQCQIVQAAACVQVTSQVGGASHQHMTTVGGASHNSQQVQAPTIIFSPSWLQHPTIVKRCWNMP